mgnify:CR=1 FL=1
MFLQGFLVAGLGGLLHLALRLGHEALHLVTGHVRHDGVGEADRGRRPNDPAAAEQRFRTALARRPNFQPAMEGLERALRQQGRMAGLPLSWIRVDHKQS